MVVTVVVLLALGCSAPELTEADMDAMSDQEAAALLDCQIAKVYEDMPQDQADRYVQGIFDKAQEEIEEGGPTVQERLWEDGYVCEEYV